MLAEDYYTTDVDGAPGSWRLQTHARDRVFRDSDMSRADDHQVSYPRAAEDGDDVYSTQEQESKIEMRS